MSGAAFKVNYPGRDIDTTMTGDVAFPVEKNIHRFTFTDDVRDWRSIPKQIASFSDLGFDSDHPTKSFVLIPYCPYSANQYLYINPFKRQLYLNLQNDTVGPTRGNKKPVVLNRPTDHDAYLHSISWMAFDWNEPLPLVDRTKILTEMNVVRVANGKAELTDETMDAFSLLVNAFGAGVHGKVIDVVDTTGVTPINSWTRSNSYTTAHFPDMAYPSTTNTHEKRMADNVKVMSRLSEAGPRTNALKGMLPTDWANNMFGIAVYNDSQSFTDGGSLLDTASSDSLLWDSRKRTIPGDDPDGMSISNYGSSAAEMGVGLDYMQPIINNELNIKIPDSADQLLIEVDGPGWFHWVDIVGYPNAAKGEGIDDKPYRTLVLMPVRVVVDIWYRPQ